MVHDRNSLSGKVFSQARLASAPGAFKALPSVKGLGSGKNTDVAAGLHRLKTGPSWRILMNY
jgi:hypothetical protein